MAGRFSNPNYQFFDENGDPLAAGELEFFESGTSTPQDTYSDDALTVPNTNPVILDSAGRAGDIFLTSADYKVVLKKSDKTVVWTADPVRAPTPKSTVVVDVSAATTVSTGDDGSLYAANATGGGFLITLPAAADAGNGFEWSAIKVDSTSNTVTVDGNGSETINGNLDYTLSQQWATVTLRCDGSEWYITAESVSRENAPFDPAHVEGLKLENGTTPASDVLINPGSARDDGDAGNVLLSSSITKRLNAAFSEGNNQGGLDTGTVAADTTYHVFIIGKTDGTADGLFSTSKTNPSLPGGFNFKRRIGTLRTDSGSSIIANAFVQVTPSGEETTIKADTTTGTTVNVTSMLQDDVIKMDLDFFQTSTDTNSQPPIIQLGPSGGAVNTGYISNSGVIAATTAAETANSDGFYSMRAANFTAANPVRGVFSLQKVDGSNDWLCSGTISDNTQIGFTAGEISLAGPCEIVDLTTPGGAANFDNGSVTLRAKNYN